MKILISLQTKNKSETWKVNKEYQKLDQREEGKEEATGKVRTILYLTFSNSLIIREGGLDICDSIRHKVNVRANCNKRTGT